jgi:predicted RNA binding protein YcfA (HicA-like mRNA interferase family)
MKPKEMVRLLESNGFVEFKVNGSHHWFRNDDKGLMTGVPMHGSKELNKKTEQTILKQAGLK